MQKQLARKQAGAFLLEALIGLLIFSFGILGIVALQAQSMRFTNDAELRAEATYLANSLISQMWTDYDPNNRAVFKSKYASPAGAAYLPFKSAVQTALGAGAPAPVVTIDDANPAICPAAPSTTSSVVCVKISWQLPGDSTVHNYATTGVVGLN
jgi:type IV pilus assembly protein PilV